MLIKWDDMKAEGAVKVQVACTSRFDQRKAISGMKEGTRIGMDSWKRWCVYVKERKRVCVCRMPLGMHTLVSLFV